MKHKNLILSGQQFYSSKQLTNKNSWEEENFSYTRNDQLNSVIDDNVVSYRNYNYVIINAGEATKNDFTTTSTEIWRLKRENPQQFNQVLQKDATGTNNFIKLTKFKNKLYAVSQNGSVFKTKNGTKWEAVASPSLPENINVTDLAASVNKIYLAANNIVYSSKNGQTWKKIKGDYREEDAQKIVIFNDQLYIYTINDNDKASVWQKNNNKWEKVLSGQKEMYLLKQINDNLYIIKDTTQNEQEASYSVLESADGQTFTEIHSGQDIATQMYNNDENLLLLVSKEDENYLVKL